MTTALAERPQNASILYTVTAETIEARRAELMALKVNGADDATGLSVVKEKLKEVVNWRTTIEKTRKVAKEEYLEAGRRVDEEAKKIQALIAPIEAHLAGQKKLVDDERARIKREEEDAVFNARQKRLVAIGGQPVGRDYLMSLSEPAFAVYVENEANRVADQRRQDEERQKTESERQRLEAEAAERNRVESERLAAERAELDRQQAELREQREAMQAVNAAARKNLVSARRSALAGTGVKISDDHLAAMDEFGFGVFLHDAQDLAAKESARREEEERNAVARQAQERADAERRAEELKPVRQKLRDFATKIRLMPLPEVSEEISGEVDAALYACADRIESLARGLI